MNEKLMAVLMAMLVALMPFSIDAYLPAIPEMAQSLGADVHRIEQSLSLFMFGTAFGQVVGGSVSDIKGRKPVALTGLAVYCLAVAAIAFASSAEQLLNLRVVQAFGAGMTVVIVGAMVRDYYSGRKAAQMFALIGIILMIVPLVAPMVGAVLQGLGGWQAIFVFLAAYSLVLLGLVQYFLPKPAIVGKIGRDVFGLVAGRFKRVLRTRAAMGYLFFQAFSFGSMFAFLTESSFVYQQLYRVTPHQYAWAFALNIITMMFFNRITAWRLKTGAHPQSILLWGIVVQFAANLSQLAAVLLFGLPPFWLLVACVMFSVGTQEHAGMLYVLFQRRGRQRKRRIGCIPIFNRRGGRYGGDLLARRFGNRDGGNHDRVHLLRHCASVALLASCVERKRAKRIPLTENAV